MKKFDKKIPAAVKHTVLIFLLSFIGQPTLQGYIHPADPFVLLAAMRLPTQQALLACGIASAAADLAKGYYALAPFTLAIKLAMVLAVKLLTRLSAATGREELFASVAALIPVPGYFLSQLITGYCYEWFTGNNTSPIGMAIDSLRKNLIQGAASLLVFLILFDLIKSFRKLKASMAEIKAEQEKKEAAAQAETAEEEETE